MGAAPSLAAAGASLAAAFLEKGLDGGDAGVLQRLMGLLAAPLAQWGAAGQVRQRGLWAWARIQARPPCNANVCLHLVGLQLEWLLKAKDPGSLR